MSYRQSYRALSNSDEVDLIPLLCSCWRRIVGPLATLAPSSAAVAVTRRDDAVTELLRRLARESGQVSSLTHTAASGATGMIASHARQACR